MPELRSVDPRTLKPNPNNPRRTPVPPAMDEQLVASIKAIGIIQPPVVREADGELVVKAGGRRVKAAITAELPTIYVLVKNDDDDTTVPMVSLSENLIRASMTSVDIWRGVEDLEKRGWNEQAIADALNLPVCTIKRLKLLAHIHPPMLDVMAQGGMPTEEQLRTIAAATLEEQAQVWKKNKPKKGHDVYWHEIARALFKRRIPFSAAKFDDDLARAYGWSGRTTCSFRQARMVATRPTSRASSALSRNGWRTTCPNAAASSRRTSTAAPSFRRKPSRSTASRARPTRSGTTSTRTPARSRRLPIGYQQTRAQPRPARSVGQRSPGHPSQNPGRTSPRRATPSSAICAPTRSTRPCGNATSMTRRCWRCSCWPSAARTYRSRAPRRADATVVRSLPAGWSKAGCSRPTRTGRGAQGRSRDAGRVPLLDRSRLLEAIAARRHRLAEREVDLVAACERAVAHGAGRHVRVDDRATWDRAAWNRYVGTATQLEPEFMPEMLRLIREIERLERLAVLPATPRPAAA